MRILLILLVVAGFCAVLWYLNSKKDSTTINSDSSGTDDESFPIIAAEQSPWGVPLVDLRPFTHTVIATSSDQKCAENSMSYGGETGEAFFDKLPSFANTTKVDLRYSLGAAERLLPGVLFTPSSMDQKWAIFCDERLIIFIRSWQREVVAAADYHCENREVIITNFHGDLQTGAEGDMIEAELDYLIRTHILGDDYPIPIEAFTESKAIGLIAFSTWGNMASFAAQHPIPKQKTDAPLISNSLLHISLAQNDPKRAIELLDAGYPIDGLAQDGLTTLHWASVSEDSQNMVELLLARGCSIDAPTAEGATLLMNEAQDGDAETMTYYIELGADPNARDDKGFTALHRCSEMGRLDLVEILVKAGADPKAETAGHTPITLAASRGHESIVKFLEANQ